MRRHTFSRHARFKLPLIHTLLDTVRAIGILICPHCGSADCREIDSSKAECLRCGEWFCIQPTELEEAA